MDAANLKINVICQSKIQSYLLSSLKVMSARSSPKTPKSKKKSSSNSTAHSSNKSKKSNVSGNNSAEGLVELKNGHFLVQVTAENSSKNNRPQPLKVYINIDDMREMHMAGGDFVLVKKVDMKETVLQQEKSALGIAWPMQSILSSSMSLSRLSSSWPILFSLILTL